MKISFDEFKQTEVPKFKQRDHYGDYAKVLDAFLESGSKCVVKDCGDKVMTVYNGLYRARTRMSLKDRVSVTRTGAKVYLIRKGD